MLIGSANVVIGYAIFVLLHFLFAEYLHYLLIMVLTHIIGVSIAFLLLRNFVFSANGHWLHEYVRCHGTYLMVLILNSLNIYILVEFFRLPAPLAFLISIPITTIISYLGHKYFSFKKT